MKSNRTKNKRYKKEMTGVLWFRKDLRLKNNKALLHASKNYKTIIPVYIFEEPTEYGGAQKVWLHHSLNSLNVSLNNQLVLLKGDPNILIPDLCKKISASSVFVNIFPSPLQIENDEKIKTKLNENSIKMFSFDGYNMFDFNKIKTKSNTDFKVFSPFYKACLAGEMPSKVDETKIEMNIFQKFEDKTNSLTVDDLNLIPNNPDWSKDLFNDLNWEPGEKGGLKKLDEFIKNGLPKYDKSRDIPSESPAATSLLSPHLHFGEISPHQAWYSAENSSCTEKTISKFKAELGWREFSYYLLKQFPTLPTENFNSKFDVFPWQNNKNELKKWQKGQTGFPIVDAGMRQLYSTGYMHNRLRMIVASFLTKDLFIHWKYGAAWFWDTLFDADIANNAAGWQWTAGSGADASPYFRVFNPMLQSKKFDKNGKYLRKWIPELALLPDKYIHEPWTAPENVLKKAKVVLGKTYPKPITDHAAARIVALAKYDEVKAANSKN